MRKAVLAVVSLFLASPAWADASERLLHAALANYFTRHFCELRHPETASEIHNAFQKSKLKGVTVPCQEMTCSTPEFTNGMKVLWKQAERLSETESLEICASYAESLKELEEQYREELGNLSASRP
jgi:hypothetical protein